MNEFEYMICRIEETLELNNPKEFIKRYDLNKHNRHRDVVILRHELMFLLRKKTKLSVEKIGKLFDKNHATVVNAIKNIEAYKHFKDKIYLDTISRYKDELDSLNYNLL